MAVEDVGEKKRKRNNKIIGTVMFLAVLAVTVFAFFYYPN
jgi:hypothetical protein